MSWVKRGKRTYFYRSVRRGGRVTKVYLGRGELAQAGAQADALRQSERRQQALELQDLKQHLDSAQRAVGELSKMVELMGRSALLLAGFHQHARSEWRRRRGRTRP